MKLKQIKAVRVPHPKCEIIYWMFTSATYSCQTDDSQYFKTSIFLNYIILWWQFFNSIFIFVYYDDIFTDTHHIFFLFIASLYPSRLLLYTETTPWSKRNISKNLGTEFGHPTIFNTAPHSIPHITGWAEANLVLRHSVPIKTLP